MYIVSEFTVSRSTVWGDLGVYTLGISITRVCTLEVYTLGAPPGPPDNRPPDSHMGLHSESFCSLHSRGLRSGGLHSGVLDKNPSQKLLNAIFMKTRFLQYFPFENVDLEVPNVESSRQISTTKCFGNKPKTKTIFYQF